MPTLSIGQSEPHSKKIFSEAIKFIERTDHSHIFVTWKDESLDVRKIAEAVGSGGKMVSNNEFKRRNKVVNIFQYEATEEQLKLVEKWLWNHLGSYGTKGIFGLLIMRVKMLCNRVICFELFRPTNPYKDGANSQICCEMALRALEQLGIKPKKDIEDLGLRETDAFLRETGVKASQRKIDRINGKK